MRKLLVGLTALVLGVAFVVPGFAKKPEDAAKSEVIWTVPDFIELSVSAESFTFPELPPGTDEYLAEKAVILYVRSNTRWSLGFTIEGDRGVTEHLKVLLSQNTGSGNADVPVNYQLIKLRDMAPGTYKVTVVYTATSK